MLRRSQLEQPPGDEKHPCGEEQPNPDRSIGDVVGAGVAAAQRCSARASFSNARGNDGGHDGKEQQTQVSVLVGLAIDSTVDVWVSYRHFLFRSRRIYIRFIENSVHSQQERGNPQSCEDSWPRAGAVDRHATADDAERAENYHVSPSQETGPAMVVPDVEDGRTQQDINDKLDDEERVHFGVQQTNENSVCGLYVGCLLNHYNQSMVSLQIRSKKKAEQTLNPDKIALHTKKSLIRLKESER